MKLSDADRMLLERAIDIAENPPEQEYKDSNAARAFRDMLDRNRPLTHKQREWIDRVMSGGEYLGWDEGGDWHDY